jgi:cytochrome c oxidase subunit 2
VDNPLVVPVGKKVRIITTANDVIHSWMVPAFGVKQDAIPGFVRDTWFRAEKTGDYYGQCAELCGKEHAYMPIHVKVLPPTTTPPGWRREEEDGRRRRRPGKVWTLDELRPAAKRSMPPTARPATRPTARAPGHQAAGRQRHRQRPDGRADARGAEGRQRRHAVLEAAVRHRMAAVVTYTKNHWSNKTGQLVQPAESRPPAGKSEPAA